MKEIFELPKCLCGNSMYRTTDGNWDRDFEAEAWKCSLEPKCRVLLWKDGKRVKWEIGQGATSIALGPYRIGFCLAVWDEEEV